MAKSSLNERRDYQDEDTRRLVSYSTGPQCLCVHSLAQGPLTYLDLPSSVKPTFGTIPFQPLSTQIHEMASPPDLVLLCNFNGPSALEKESSIRALLDKILTQMRMAIIVALSFLSTSEQAL